MTVKDLAEMTLKFGLMCQKYVRITFVTVSNLTILIFHSFASFLPS